MAISRLPCSITVHCPLSIVNLKKPEGLLQLFLQPNLVDALMIGQAGGVFQFLPLFPRGAPCDAAVAGQTSRHGDQLACYTRAVKDLFGRAPDACFIYSLPLGRSIPIELAADGRFDGML